MNLGWATSFYTVDANYLVDGNRTAASNYCRLFLDNYWPTWCFVGTKWNNCAVPLCPNIPGQLIGTPPEDCGLPPPVRNSYMIYGSIKINSTVLYTCSIPYNYITGSISARCQDDGTWTRATLVCSPCTTPPLIPRTTITYLDANYTMVNYTCLDVDIYISGTTTASCTYGIWGTASILCAPTTCWFQRLGGLPAYKGTTTTTATGINCADWSNSQPLLKQNYYTLDSSFIMDGSKANAKNYCRIFNDGYKSTWCYTTVPGVVFADCNVPMCPDVAGVLVV
ncbi:plasminogen-like [Pomacea canaliculata]|uniref:plasminogen-like n=1 Tax=Pomacea canaliculata TaxID=400727 RepID=UPI000D73A3A8|nr:plasminogen-like [Pomacea canaliculata]